MTHPTASHSQVVAAVHRAASRIEVPSILALTHQPGGGVDAAPSSMDQATIDEYGVRVVLHATALGLARSRHVLDPLDGYAMVLPQQGLAYLAEATGQATTIRLRPDATDNPQQRRDALAGLRTMLAAINGTDTAQKPVPRPRAFTVLDSITPTRRPHDQPRPPPAAGSDHRHHR